MPEREAINRIVSVVGTGSIGMRHLRVAASMPGVRAIAVPVSSRAREESWPFGVVVASSLADAIAEGTTHVVVASDTSRHPADASEALALGTHVLVEKPIAASVVALDAFERAAGDAASRVVAAHCMRFHPVVSGVRALLPRLGRVHHCRAACASYLPDWRPERDYRASYSARANEGGVLRDLVHEIDYAGWYFGFPNAVFAYESRGRLGIDAEEAVDLLWQLDEGASSCTVSLHLDYLTRVPRRMIEIAGERGNLDADLLSGHVDVRLHDGTVESFSLSTDRDEMMRRQLEAFLRRNEGTSLSEARLGLATCDAARRSISSGARESLREHPT